MFLLYNVQQSESCWYIKVLSRKMFFFFLVTYALDSKRRKKVSLKISLLLLIFSLTHDKNQQTANQLQGVLLIKPPPYKRQGSSLQDFHIHCQQS